MRKKLFTVLMGLFLLISIIFAGCTTMSQEVPLPAQPLNFSPDIKPIPKPTLYIANKIPFSSLPDVTIEPIPGMVVNISSSNKSLQLEPRDGTPITPPPVSEKPLFTTFHVGESANDGNTRITLNSVEYNKSFSLEPYNQHGEFSSYRQGYQLMVLNVTIRDLGAGSEGNEGLFNGIIIKDTKGQRLVPGLSIVSDAMVENRERNGYLFYEVPENTTGITLEYHFPETIGVLAKFDLRN
ncbi:MAG: DUF4352 domain-containing protein [Methanoregulaceae archaeon]|nr:DUF4352 domain-containing protein [Methanoregulaceae archaeon]